MRKRKTLLSVVLCAAVAVLIFVALRAMPRWLTVQKLLSSPERAALLAVIPEPMMQVVLPADSDSALINIGYAEFSLPSDIEPNMTARGEGHIIMLESDRQSLGFLAPGYVDATEFMAWFLEIEAVAGMSEAEAVAKHLLSARAGIHPVKANLIDMQFLAAEARLLPFSTIFMMSQAEFKAYMAKLIMKTLLSVNAERILPYQGLHSMGLIYLREGGSRGVVELTTHDRKISQAISFEVDEVNEQFPTVPFATFLATYRFTIESKPSRDKIAKLIAKSGINPWVPPAEVPAEHTVDRTPH